MRDQVIFKYSLSKDPLPIKSAHDTDLYEVPMTLYQYKVPLIDLYEVPVTLYQYKVPMNRHL